MSPKLASVDHRGDQYVISTFHRSTNGWIAPDKPVVLPDSVDAVKLGVALRYALDGSQLNVPPPADPDSISRPLLEMFGLQDYAQYMRGATSVHARLTAQGDGTESIKVTPQKNSGPRAGFTPISTAAEVMVYKSEEQLGEAVLRGLRQAR